MLDDPRSEVRPIETLRAAATGSGSAENRRVRAAVLDAIGRDVGKPLALILGAAGELKDRVDAEDTVGSALADTVLREAARLERFIPALLDLAKLESSCVDVRVESVNLKDVVGRAVKDSANALKERKVDIRLQADLPPLKVDPAILRRALLILVDNAARQSPKGSTVGIHVGRDRTAVRIQILDEGEGIPTNEIAGLFDQFHLPADDQSRAGAGLHLAVCRGLVEAIGGTISGYNRTDGGGAVFTITFPLPV